jgi:thiamine kinase-like enzyme
MADYPETLLHNDVCPPNCGLPPNADGECVLVDWEMVGWGLAEMDLAYMFMQPFASERMLDRSEMLEYYWQQRHVLEGVRQPADVERATQRYADAVLALWLVPVAHRVTARPYPEGSAPGDYWEGMFGVLHGRLKALCEGI